MTFIATGTDEIQTSLTRSAEFFANAGAEGTMQSWLNWIEGVVKVARTPSAIASSTTRSGITFQFNSRVQHFDSGAPDATVITVKATIVDH